MIWKQTFLSVNVQSRKMIKTHRLPAVTATTVVLYLCLLQATMSLITTTSLFRPAKLTLAFFAPSPVTYGSRSLHRLVPRAAPLCHKRKSAEILRGLCSARMTVSKPATPDTELTGPSWELEYDSLDAPSLLADVASAERFMDDMERDAEVLKPLVAKASSMSLDEVEKAGIIPCLTNLTKTYWDSAVLLRNVATQAGCAASVDGGDVSAKKMSSATQVRFARLRQAYEPASLFLDLCADDVFNAFLREGDDEIRAAEYIFRHSRRMRRHKLSLQEENMLTTMSVTGHSSWGTLYTDLSASISVTVSMPDGSSRSMGIASADAMRDNPDPSIRRASWEAIREGWLPHRESCAAALNAITGWRLELYKKRDYPSFMTSSLHQNRMSNATLSALLSAIDDSSHIGRRALNVQARALGQDSLCPWDLYAPAPVDAGTGKLYSFDEGIELIASAVAEVDPDAGSFVRKMRDERWIEASRGDKKRPGA